MLKLPVPNYRFCPLCGTKLESKSDGEKARRTCPSDGWVYYPRVATSCMAVIVKDKETLLVKRNREPYKGTWMFPAGFVEYGEHPKEAVKREVKEETGLTATKVTLVSILQSVDDAREPGHFLFLYQVEVKDGVLKTDANENTDIAWFSLGKLPKIGFKTHQQVAKLLARPVE